MTSLRAPSRVGVEVDGAQVRVVQVVSGVVRAGRTVTGDVTAALEGLPAAAQVRAHVAGTTRCALLTAEQPPVTGPDLIALVERHNRAVAQPLPTTAATAGFVHPPVVATLPWQVLVVTAAPRPVAEVHQAWAGALVAPTAAGAAVAAPGGGLVLAVRESDCELTLTSADGPLATCALAAGGIGAVYALLGAEDDIGRTRVRQVLHGSGGDPLAVSTLAGWFEEVCAQVAEQAERWRTAALPTPDHVVVHGVVASWAGVDAALARHDLRRAPLPAPVVSALLDVPPAQRDELVGPLLVAWATPGPLGVFHLPEPLSAPVGLARRARGLLLVLAALGVGAAVGWGAHLWVTGPLTDLPPETVTAARTQVWVEDHVPPGQVAALGAALEGAQTLTVTTSGRSVTLTATFADLAVAQVADRQVTAAATGAVTSQWHAGASGWDVQWQVTW